jgi:hypothetical protein
MRKAAGGTCIRTGKASLELTADDLFDRIINLKFIRKSGRHFTLRSDYEPVFHRDGTISFRTCSQKPDIKINYKQVAESVAIEVDIEITNFFTGDRDKESVESMNTADGDPVQWCVIQMGYRRQFPDWTKIKDTTDLARFWDLNNNNITSESEVRRGRQILVQILTGYPKTYPPDRITYFKGILGTLENGLRWNHTEKELIKGKGYGDSEFPDGYSEIERVLFQFVTRRFIRASVQHIAVTTQDFTNQEAFSNVVKKKFEQKVLIYGFKDYNNAGPNAVHRLQSSITTASRAPADTEWTELPLLDNGIMSVENAYKFGVICAVSKTLQSMPENALYGYGLTKRQAAALRSVPAAPFDDMQDTIGGQLTAIQRHYPFIRWYELTDGSFYFYHEKDTDKDLWSDPFIKEMQKDNTHILPAVYDITPSGTRTIRCPFISFISSMTTVVFQSRFTIGTLVSFYYPPRTNAFLVIIAAIEFATVQDSNLMELMCVDLPPHEIEASKTGEIDVGESKQTDETPNETPGATPGKTPGETPGKPPSATPNEPPDETPDETPGETPEAAQVQQPRDLQWFEKTLKVVPHKTGATDTDSRWANIVEKELKPSFKAENWPEGQMFTEALALNALKDWNPEYFDPDGTYMKRSDAVLYGKSIENNPSGIGGRTGIEVPWLKTGDKIIVRYPFQSEYPDDEKVVP